MKKSILIRCLVLSVMILIAGCKKDEAGPPVSVLEARAGNDQNVLVGQTVNLSGILSADSKNIPFEYSWSFVELPAGSGAQIENPESATVDFVPDVSGRYQVELRVFHNSESRDTVLISAYSVTDIAGSYEPKMPGTDVGVRVFRTVCDTLYATCEFSMIGGIAAKKIARFDGTEWSPLGCGLEDGSIYDMIDYNCELYVTGQFEEIGCTEAFNIARWDGKEWHPVKGGLTGGDNAFGYSLEVFEGDLYVGGQFTMAGNVSVSNLARWDGENWYPAGNFEEGSVREMEIYKGQLYAGGYFETVDGKPAEGFAIYNGTGWVHPGHPGSLSLGKTGWVRDMEVYNDKLFISGEFYINDEDVSELITWDGSEFHDFGRTFSLYENYIYDLKTIDDILYIGGRFNNVAGSTTNNVIQWDGTQWGHLSNGVIGVVLTIEEFRDQIFVGGEFNSAGGLSAENIVIWEKE